MLKGIEAINSGTPQSIEDNVGGRWYFSKIVPLKDKYEKITSLAIFSDDITERKKNAGDWYQRAVHETRGLDGIGPEDPGDIGSEMISVFGESYETV